MHSAQRGQKRILQPFGSSVWAAHPAEQMVPDGANVHLHQGALAQSHKAAAQISTEQIHALYGPCRGYVAHA